MAFENRALSCAMTVLVSFGESGGLGRCRLRLTLRVSQIRSNMILIARKSALAGPSTTCLTIASRLLTFFPPQPSHQKRTLAHASSIARFNQRRRSRSVLPAG
jgi:hypothetical protein